MVRVRSTAEMSKFLEWEGEVPDEIPEDERWYWIKHNIEGDEFYEPDPTQGDWIWGTEVEVIKDKD